MKKILITLLTTLFCLFGYNLSYANYNVIDNTNDGVHNGMAATLIQIGTNYLNGVTNQTTAWQQLVDYISQISGGAATASAYFDSNGALHIGCSNNGSLIVFQPINVVTTSSSITSGCSSYISSWNTIWSNCSINSSWTPSGTIICQQTASYTSNSSSCGSQTCETTYVDGVPSGTSCGPCTGCPGNVPQPNYPPVTKTVSLNLTPTSTCNGSQYANNIDSCKITFNVSSVTEQNRGITSWGSNGNITNITDKSGQKSDRILNSGKALNFDGVSSSGIPASTSNNFNVDITGIKSRTPFISTTGKIGFQLGGVQINDLTNINYNFKKPFVGYIKTWDNINNTWNGVTNLGTEMKYKIGLTEKSNLIWASLNNYTLNDFSSSIEPNGVLIEIQSKSVSGTTLTNKTGTIFYSRINTSSSATSLNQNPGLQINLPIVSYNLGGETVKYYLSEQDAGNDNTPIKTTGSEFIGVRVIGGIQGAGKSEFTGQNANISNISSLDVRTKIRKNAYTYIKNMTNGQVINGVKYVEGDVSISGDQTYETLVVKNGNVIITGDLNTSNKKLGIIVIKDGYDVNTGYLGEGNVYIKKDVAKINSIIYADGGLISINNSGVPYNSDSYDRTSDLKNQLIMNGSLFTRNTIGGAILAGGYYILPGGSKLNNTEQNFNLAMQYDLNYIRRGNLGCDKNSNGNCTNSGEYKEPFIIKYDSRAQTNPPKLFDN